MNAKQQQTPPDIEVGQGSGYRETGSEGQTLETLKRQYDEIQRMIAEEAFKIARTAERLEQQISSLGRRVEELETDGAAGTSRPAFGGGSGSSIGRSTQGGPSNSTVDYSAAALQLGLLLWATPRRGLLQWLPLVPGAMSILDNKDKSPLKSAAFPLVIGGVSAVGAGRVFK